jgi:hypothetical protein
LGSRGYRRPKLAAITDERQHRYQLPAAILAISPAHCPQFRVSAANRPAQKPAKNFFDFSG